MRLFLKEKAPKRTLTKQKSLETGHAPFPSYSFFPYLLKRKKERIYSSFGKTILLYPVPCRTQRDTRDRVAEEMSTSSMTCR